ncbi:Mitochondrial presequence protease [Tritrichomonas foetus]|uniref:Mitochondrial presequence protease n=1 Tax=Tritrichomonas foetus TaxID=1144522 RepID=A0A1J4K665_9EUKA|nr:Mitochondrial presequence protease [Tritrichomonas foetus]|eukprot:OHT05182.1 Mitochondrial presequence protease [Tritrichomonas foetus]
MHLISDILAYTVPLSIAISSFFAFAQITRSDTIHNFAIKDKFELPELNAVAYLYIHSKHGCPFLHIETSDTHNFFATTYKTTCIDSTGSTHVLEHLSLHGSEKYPITSVFIELRKRSLATFMNAFTSIEWTAYPFSSTNLNDFHNILDVYLDASFHPQLTEIGFQSECHHLEFEVPNDTSTALRHSGVVYNEMNGEFSNPTSRFSSLIRKNLYPDSVFGLEYGGNPPDIATLTLQKIKEQHDRYYHPSNSLFYHYGSFNVEKILKKVDEVISPFDKKPAEKFKISEEKIFQPKWSKPKAVIEEGPEDIDKSKVRASVSWMVGDLRNITDVADFQFLELLLLQSHASPLYKALIQGKLGTRLIGSGYHNYIRSSYFSIGLEGVDKSNMTTYNQTILDALEDIYKKGFEKIRIDSIIHQLEISKNSVSNQQGIENWQSLISSWIHDVSPFEILNNEWQIERIKRVLKINPRYFEMILKYKIIENPHRLDLVMVGVPNFLEKQAQSVKEELEKIKSKMSKEELNEIVEQTKKIQEIVDVPKPLHLLPVIKVSDINQTQSVVTFEKLSDRISFFNQPTKDLVYVTLKCEIPINSQSLNIKENKNMNNKNENKNEVNDDGNDFYLISLLSSILTSVGADEFNETEFTNQISLNTGGISTSILVVPSNEKSGELSLQFLVSGSALSRNSDKLVELLEKVIFKPWLNNTVSIGILLQSLASAVPEKISGTGHLYAMMYSQAGLSRSSTLKEILNGVSFNRNILKLSNSQNWDQISKDLIKVHQKYIMNGKFTAMIHSTAENKNKIYKPLNSLVEKLPNQKIENDYDVIDQLSKKYLLHNQTLLKIDSSTYFCGVSVPGPHFSSKSSTSYSVASQLIKSEFLHDAIREKLGAYGSVSRFSSLDATMSFASYRDTSPIKVLQAIDDSIKSISLGQINDEMINRSIISLFSSLDSPESPNEVGNELFFYNLSSEIKQKRRTAFLNTNKADVQKVFEEIEKRNEKRKAIVGGSIEEKLIPGLYVIDVFNVDKTDNSTLII